MALFKCQFANVDFNHGETFYCCLFEKIQPPLKRVLQVYGDHQDNKNNNDVIHIKFNNCFVSKIPQQLTFTFPNLRNIVIHNSKLRNICKQDFAEYKNLEIISLSNNDLEYLPGDLFQHNQRLKIINFRGNMLTLIEPHILNGFNELNMVNFSQNPNYDKCYSIYSVHNSNATLQEVKNDLYEKFYSRFEFLQDLKKSEKFLKLENQQLKNKLKVENLPYNLINDIKNCIQDENTKDFSIKIGNQEFRVHKFLLFVRSSTLAEILRNNPEVESLNLVDISVNIFENILKFFYTDELPRDDETNFLQLFAAAGRLKIKVLTDYAANRLLYRINSDNVLEVLSLSNKFDYDELKEKAIAELKKKYNYVKDEWLEDQEKLKDLIEMFKEKEDAERKFKEKLNKKFWLPC